MNPGQAGGLSGTARFLAMGAIFLATGICTLETSIINLALPALSDEFGIDAARSVWAVSAYQVAIIVLLLPLASLGEIKGYDRVYTIGIGVFTLASLACALAGSFSILTGARILQGAGAAGVFALNSALIRYIYPPDQLGRGLAANGFVVAISLAAAPSVASLILAISNWRWLFALNVPLGVLALVVGRWHLPKVPGNSGKLALVSSLLNAVLMSGLFVAASDASEGKFDAKSAIILAVAVFAGAALFTRSRKQTAPLIPLDLLGLKILRWSYAVSFGAFAAYSAVMIAFPFYLGDGLGYSHLEIGLYITIWPVAIAITAPFSGRLVERMPAALLGGSGMALLAIGLGMLAIEGMANNRAWLSTALVISGVGFGLFQVPNNRVMIGMAPAARSGAAAGMLAMSRLIGFASGAVLSAWTFRMFGPTSTATFILASLMAAMAGAASLRRML